MAWRSSLEEQSRHCHQPVTTSSCGKDAVRPALAYTPGAEVLRITSDAAACDIVEMTLTTHPSHA